ncbi:MAG: hypothetical protein EBZ48_13990 [Proteobacteria bacterium]|nr:hypothetical protein [Pseudomonadota bacterium]
MTDRFAENRKQFEKKEHVMSPRTVALFRRIYTEPREDVEKALEGLDSSSGAFSTLQNLIQMKETQVKALRPVPVHLPQRGHVARSSEAAVRNELKCLEGHLHVVAKQWLSCGLSSDEVYEKIRSGMDLSQMATLRAENQRSTL